MPNQAAAPERNRPTPPPPRPPSQDPVTPPLIVDGVEAVRDPHC
ncbi:MULTISPECIES: hypothetical protein [Bradyrhizobium]|jgi:hypothetical protein|nr:MULTISPECIES: hypothetical protein [Bradyrhizobium]MDU1494745.1 hypothetical protein [Bradyrhizobium sp.]MDU2927186.1 hypothetical protein [Bradyrhizobium sp.]MDU3226132.1 hypothetical protein [Bradyrhizobium sp.]MDU6138073.1 hypothetical protein [Bradyrhizobium sp.]MDU6324543.1 hypothetical protein [Bradyrhizobium sp.]